jgi:ABC-type lipoprotein release transport system permease subunit
MPLALQVSENVIIALFAGMTTILVTVLTLVVPSFMANRTAKETKAALGEVNGHGTAMEILSRIEDRQYHGDERLARIEERQGRIEDRVTTLEQVKRSLP